MSDDAGATTATHSDPAWRSAANYIVRVDLGPHGMQGRWEQWWCRDMGARQYELCCIPFFTYGFALGDVFELDSAHRLRLIEPSGRSTLRFGFRNREVATAKHEAVHGVLVEHDCLLEVSGPMVIAVDCVGLPQMERLLAALEPDMSSGDLLWEWGNSVEAPS